MSTNISCDVLNWLSHCFVFWPIFLPALASGCGLHCEKGEPLRAVMFSNSFQFCNILEEWAR